MSEKLLNEGVLYFCLFRTLKYQAPAGQYRANLFVTENIECLSMWKGLYSYPFVCNTLQIYTIFNIFNMFANTKVTIIAKFGSVVILATYTCFATKLEGRFSCSTSTPLKSFRGVIYYPPFNLKSIRACRITRIVESVFLLRHFRWRGVRHGCVKIQQ